MDYQDEIILYQPDEAVKDEFIEHHFYLLWFEVTKIGINWYICSHKVRKEWKIWIGELQSYLKYRIKYGKITIVFKTNAIFVMNYNHI